MALGTLYVCLIIADLFLMLQVAFGKREERQKTARLLRKLAVIVTTTVFSSVLAMLLPMKSLALFFQSIHYITTEWMLIYLLLFLEYYVGRTSATMRTRLPFMIYAACSTVSLLCNGVFHHVVDCQRVVVNGTEHLNKFTNKEPFYQLHLYFCYLLVLIIVMIILGAWVTSSKINKKKYFWGIIILFVTIALEGICSWKDFVHDFSLFGYISLAFFFSYFTLYYFPKDVMNKMLIYMVQDSRNGAICFDASDKCIFVNEEVRSLVENGFSSEEYEARYKARFGVEHFEDAEDHEFLVEFHQAERTVYVEMSFRKLYDDRGRYMGAYIFGYDKTEDIKELEEQRYRATHDSLTDLYNKDYFYENVLECMHENPKDTFCLVCTDIKDFKLINELFGYEKGNEILCRFADRLKNSLPEEVVVARLVSDRFALFMKKELFTEDYLLDCLNDAQNLLSTSEFQLYIHAGVYEVQPGDEDVSVMCDHAEMAIGTVKNDYNRIIAFYDERLMDKLKKEKQMINEFEYALENNQFVMYLQPQVDANGVVYGAEALVRWFHPEKGMISPGEFIPVFENSGLIHKLDMCIWEQAAKKLKEWKAAGCIDKHISVNISTKDFYYVDLYKVFTELVHKYDLSTKQLKLEITESAFMQDQEKQLELIGRLQDFGFDVEIDDFGSGYSSLNMLKDFNADVLKIDMGFLREINDRERTKIILGMIVDLAKQLKMTVITEGVETKEQVDYLSSVGCDMFQGFYFARPIAVDEFEEMYIR